MRPFAGALGQSNEMDERTGKQQKAVAGASAQAHFILRRSLAELKKLQAGNEPKPAPKPNEDPIGDMSMAGVETMLGLSDAR